MSLQEWATVIFTLTMTYLVVGVVVDLCFPAYLAKEIRDFIYEQQERTGDERFSQAFEWGEQNPEKGKLIGVLIWPTLILAVAAIRYLKAKQAEERELHQWSDPWETACMCEDCCTYRARTRETADQNDVASFDAQNKAFDELEPLSVKVDGETFNVRVFERRNSRENREE